MGWPDHHRWHGGGWSHPIPASWSHLWLLVVVWRPPRQKIKKKKKNSVAQLATHQVGVGRTRPTRTTPIWVVFVSCFAGSGWNFPNLFGSGRVSGLIKKIYADTRPTPFIPASLNLNKNPRSSSYSHSTYFRFWVAADPQSLTHPNPYFKSLSLVSISHSQSLNLSN